LIVGAPLLVLGGAATLAGAGITILALGLGIAALDTDASSGVNEPIEVNAGPSLPSWP